MSRVVVDRFFIFCPSEEVAAVVKKKEEEERRSIYVALKAVLSPIPIVRSS